MVYVYPKNAVLGPMRPLMHQVVRSKTERREEYVLEIREFHADYKQHRLIPFVTIKDLKQILPNRNKQHSVWIPVHLCDEVLQFFIRARNDDSQFDVANLEPKLFVCDSTRRQVELEVVDDSYRIRSYMDVKEKAHWQEDDPQEVIELRNELIPQLVQFLHDVATRYREVNGTLDVASLFSASGGRRFYFDIRDTRWGKRLQVSQVTDFHRNVVGIPLENLVSFRDRLNDVINFLGLEDQQNVQLTPNSASQSSSANEATMKGKGGRGKRRHRRRSERLVSSGSEKNDQLPDADCDKVSSDAEGREKPEEPAQTQLADQEPETAKLPDNAESPVANVSSEQ